MNRQQFTIRENRPIARNVFRIELCADKMPHTASGQFVDIQVRDKFLRRPISVCDVTEDSMTLVYKVAGKGTEILSEMRRGESVDVLASLGHGFSPEACRSDALLIGGGLGAAPLYLLCKELMRLGKRVHVVLGFNTAGDVILEDEFRSTGAVPAIATLDGSCGVRGFVTDAIEAAAPVFDRFYCCGPLPMMKAVCAALRGPGEVSLEERMGCGAGFCYGCTWNTVHGPRRVCKDGPVFDKEDIIW